MNQILNYFGVPQAFTRYAAGTRDADGYKPGTASTFTARASIQTLAGRERQALPEGLREKEVLCVLCEVELKTVDVAAQTAADRFTWQGRTWEITWRETPDGSFQMPINYWEGYATLVPADNA